MPEELTAEQKQAYIESPNHCPFCGTENISAGQADFDDNVCLQYVECLECHRTWTDVYRMVDITPDEKTDAQLPESISDDGSIAVQNPS